LSIIIIIILKKAGIGVWQPPSSLVCPVQEGRKCGIIIIILKRIGFWSPLRPGARVSLIILKRIGV